MSRILIGCCGAYCGTCRAQADHACQGFQFGYETGERDLARAKCPMKVCCIRRYGTAHTCADCSIYATCGILNAFYAKRGHKYRRYQHALDFIRSHDYETFLTFAQQWKGTYRPLP